MVVLLFIASWLLCQPAPQSPGSLALGLSFIAVTLRRRPRLPKPNRFCLGSGGIVHRSTKPKTAESSPSMIPAAIIQNEIPNQDAKATAVPLSFFPGTSLLSSDTLAYRSRSSSMRTLLVIFMFSALLLSNLSFAVKRIASHDATAHVQVLQACFVEGF